MWKIQLLFFIFLGVGNSLSQGLINNGAHIVLTSNAHIVVDGTTGNYKNQSGGLITNATTGGTIKVNGNWTNDASNVAFSNDGATIKLSGANQTIGGTNSTTFYNLTLEGSGTKTLSVNTTVGGKDVLTLTGVLALGAMPLDLNSRTLTISNPAAAAITNASYGYIISETSAATNPSIVKWNMGTNTGAHIYPFGVGGTLIPFTFNKTTAGASDISVATRATSGGNTPWSSTVTSMSSHTPTYVADASFATVIDRWWDINVSAAVTANLTFSFRGSENTTTFAPTGSFSAQHWNGSSWDAPVGSGAGVTSGVGTVYVTGASSFSPWIISSNNSPLPVILTNFSADCDKKTRIEWSTASEQNSDKFFVQKSRDLDQWFTIETIPAAGNSNHNTDYTSQDEHPFNGVSYYRLIQRDFNGVEKIYGPVSVECENPENTITVFPNPSNGNFTVEIVSMESKPNVQLRLVDLAGKVIVSQTENLVEGVNQILFYRDFAKGIYVVQASTESNDFKPVKVIIE